MPTAWILYFHIDTDRHQHRFKWMPTGQGPSGGKYLSFRGYYARSVGCWSDSFDQYLLI